VPVEDERRVIVVGVDGSRHAEAALAWAFRQAELTCAPLVAVTCWEYPMNLGWTPGPPADFRPDEDARSMLEEAVAEEQRHHPDVAVEKVVVEGPPVPVLLDAAAGAALLVVGTRGHGGFAGLLLGSVSGHCMTHAACPVVVVRH